MLIRNKLLLLAFALIIIGVSLWMNNAMLMASNTNGKSREWVNATNGNNNVSITTDLAVDNISMLIGEEIIPENVFTGFIVVSGTSVVVNREGNIVAITLGQTVVKKIVITSRTQIMEGEFTITVI